MPFLAAAIPAAVPALGAGAAAAAAPVAAGLGGLGAGAGLGLLGAEGLGLAATAGLPELGAAVAPELMAAAGPEMLGAAAPIEMLPTSLPEPFIGSPDAFAQFGLDTPMQTLQPGADPFSQMGMNLQQGPVPGQADSLAQMLQTPEAAGKSVPSMGSNFTTIPKDAGPAWQALQNMPGLDADVANEIGLSNRIEANLQPYRIDTALSEPLPQYGDFTPYELDAPIGEPYSPPTPQTQIIEAQAPQVPGGNAYSQVGGKMGLPETQVAQGPPAAGQVTQTASANPFEAPVGKAGQSQLSQMLQNAGKAGGQIMQAYGQGQQRTAAAAANQGPAIPPSPPKPVTLASMLEGMGKKPRRSRQFVPVNDIFNNRTA